MLWPNSNRMIMVSGDSFANGVRGYAHPQDAHPLDAHPLDAHPLVAGHALEQVPPTHYRRRQAYTGGCARKRRRHIINPAVHQGPGI